MRPSVTQIGRAHPPAMCADVFRPGLGGYAAPMRLSRFVWLGLIPAAPLAFASCSKEPVPIGLTMFAPEAIKDADSVDLFVFDATDHTCGQDGAVDAIPDTAQKFPLSNQGCPDGLAWCTDIQLPRGEIPQMFAAIAKAKGESTLQGCTQATVDQDPLQVTIEMKQIIVPKCCGDGKLQVGEVCDSGGSNSCGGTMADEVCGADCTTQEELLSILDTAKPFLVNLPHTKSDVAMAFCPGNGQIGTALRTVFTSADSKATNKSDINLRVMSPDLHTIMVPEPLSQQLRLPTACTNIYGTGGKGTDLTPAIAPVSQNSTLIVYASNESNPTVNEIYVVEHSEDVCADVPIDQEPAKQVSTGSPAPGSATPVVARATDGTALIAWQVGGNVVGRIWKAGVLTPDLMAAPLQIGMGTAPRVAGGSGGWVVVYQGTSGVFKRTVGFDGKPGPEVAVNGTSNGAQVHPDVAMLDDGTYAVVWQSGSNIAFQRYSANGDAVKGDQDAPLNSDTMGGDHAAPAIAAPQSGGGFFAAVWENADGTISARYIDSASGFLFNPMDGTNASFLASSPTVTGTRHKPAVAISGFVVFGWQDDSDAHPGIYARRFPLPK
jgi:hypothetical protein